MYWKTLLIRTLFFHFSVEALKFVYKVSDSNLFNFNSILLWHMNSVPE